MNDDNKIQIEAEEADAVTEQATTEVQDIVQELPADALNDEKPFTATNAPSVEDEQQIATEIASAAPRTEKNDEAKESGRSTQFTLLKAIAIICVVLSHAGIRGWLFNFVFIFHVPVFFMCAGYFFHTKYLTDERTFVMHRFKGLYWPFLRWSVFFLVIHNLLFPLGLLSEQYGNAGGGVLHPYTWHEWSQHLWSIVFNMSGYNDFYCGTFWFFRALLIASLLFLLLFKVFRRSEHFVSHAQVGWGILGTALLLALWKVTAGLTMTGVPQGGYRELMGLAFMAAGFLMKQYKIMELTTWKVALPCALIVIIASISFPSSMVWNGTLYDFLALPIPAVVAFIALAWACGLIDRYSLWARRVLLYIGDRTLYVFAFHLVAFKVVSALKVAFYGLPWEAVSGHPTVLQPQSNVLWVLLYTIVGVALPLLWLEGYRRVASRITITEKQAVGLLVVSGQRLCHYTVLTGRFIVMACVAACRNIWQSIKDIIEASSPADE